MTIRHLPPEALYTVCDTGLLDFKTTAELPDLDRVIGQDRAVEAIQFGIGIRQEGFNLYALGPERSGKRTLVSRFIEQQAQQQTAAGDWVYVNNFVEPQKPNAMSLPSGRGNRFRKDMVQLVEELRSTVPAALESDEYRNRVQEIEDGLKDREDKALAELQKEANSHDIVMLRTPGGFVFAPSKEGKTMQAEEFHHLPEVEKKRIGVIIGNLQERLEQIIEQTPKWRRETQEEIRQLNRDVIIAAVGQLINELRQQYSDLPDVLAYLDEVQQDVIDHAEQFRRSDEEGVTLADMMMPGTQGQVLKRYRVNMLVDNSEVKGAPVVFLDHPTYPNIIGRIEHEARMGTLVTDFSMIRAGALHKANGGYLLLEARKLLMQPYAWEGLKRVLKSHEIRIESLAQAISLISTVSLEPEAIPVNVKVVLLGDRWLYYLLSEYDPEFNELFKVAADFDERIDLNDENRQNYAEFISTVIREDRLHDMDVAAVARVIEHSSRLVGDAEKLSSCFGRIADLIREADYRAIQNNHEIIKAEDVQLAIDSSHNRLSRLRERYLEETLRGTLMVDTEGEQTGQVNGLSVMRFGDYQFGHPSRITARVRMGKGEVVDIEREIELGGPIHTKGVLILRGFLAGRYCPQQQLSLSASLVFEQTYGGVEGDSASLAELCALLSALAGVPLKQGLAVTGSINQPGQVQAIGAVNEKIESFFELCQSRGLNGSQGVLIPVANVKHLMLAGPVVDAVVEGSFSVTAVETVDDAIGLLTGIDAGERDNNGIYPEGSINRLVEDRLIEMAEKRMTKNNQAY